jgi:hypothetical protein
MICGAIIAAPAERAVLRNLRRGKAVGLAGMRVLLMSEAFGRGCGEGRFGALWIRTSIPQGAAWFYMCEAGG